VKETSLISGESTVEFWMRRICELIMGHGPVQVVKMKFATQTWPVKDLLSKGWPL
jgi:hypothetical protein